MSKVVVHKFYRRLKDKAQFRLCDNKRCDMAENVRYRWHHLKKPALGTIGCRKCLKLEGSRL